jgi:hypothetical protein
VTYAVALFMGAVIFATEPLDMNLEECNKAFSDNAWSIARDYGAAFDPQTLEMMNSMVEFKCVETLPEKEIDDDQWNQLLGISQ